jgi:hypothetical protein
MADDKRIPPFLSVLVLNSKDEVLSGANVKLAPRRRGAEGIEVDFDKAVGTYVARDLSPGRHPHRLARRYGWAGPGRQHRRRREP